MRGSGQGRILLGIGFLIAPLLFSGCDTSVEVVRESDQYQYSLYGVLNVAADTQFIRVEPLGDTTRFGAPRDIDAEVYLENLDAETEVALRDSFATIRLDASPPRSARVHVFWTTHPIRAGTRYRLRLEEEGMTTVSVNTTTPSRAPDLKQVGFFYLPCCFAPEGVSPHDVCPNQFSVIAEGVETVAAAHVVYPLGERSFPTVNVSSEVIEEAIHYEGQRIPVKYKNDLARINREHNIDMEGCPPLEAFQPPYAEVIVAAGGPAWPDWRTLSFEELVNPPNAQSNVKGGHGFVGSVFPDTLRVPVQKRRSSQCACISK